MGMCWSNTKPPAKCLKKPWEDPRARSSWAFQCPAPIKPRGLGPRQHSHIHPSSDASSRQAGAVESVVLAWGLQHLPTPSLLACPPSGAEASNRCLPAGAFPKACAGLWACTGQNLVPPLHHPSSLPPSSSLPGESAEDAQLGCSDQLGSQAPRGKSHHKVLGNS